MSRASRPAVLLYPTPPPSWGPLLVTALGLWMVLGPLPSVGAPTGDEPLADPIARAKRATVGILRSDGRLPTAPTRSHFSIRGTGVHLRDGYIVTARHAVARQEGSQTVLAETIAVLTEDFHELPAALVGFSEFLDLAVYRLEPQPGPPVLGTMALDAREPQPGDQVFTVGYPLGWGPTVGFGRVGSPDTFLPTLPSRLLQLDMSACSGNSGGGLFNSRGDLVGFVHAIIRTEGLESERRCSRMAFVVPAGLARRIIDALIAGEETGFSRLGLGLSSVKVGTRWRVAVSRVTGPAREAGFEEGDILLAIDGNEVVSAAHLKSYLLERTRPGQQVRMTISRGGQEADLLVTLGSS